MRRLLLIAFLLVPGPVHAAVSYVDRIGQCDGLTPCHSTIMDAVHDATPPATIEVFPGVYHEAVTLQNKGNITLRSHNAAYGAVIVAPALATAVAIIQSPGVVLSGFIVEGGVSVAGGASYNALLDGNYIRSGGVRFLSTSGGISRGNIIDGGLDIGGCLGCVEEGNTVRGGDVNARDEGDGCGPRKNQIRNNLMLGGSIGVGARCGIENVIVGNALVGGGILVSAAGTGATANLIQGNVVRGGGITLGGTAGANTVEGNFVSESPAAGILVAARDFGSNTIQRNSSVDNAACDLDDISSNLHSPNVWLENRYVTRCGFAIEARVVGLPEAPTVLLPPRNGTPTVARTERTTP